jgi:hypothetical protein
MALGFNLPFNVCEPEPVPEVVAKLTKNGMLPPGPARLPVPAVRTAFGLNDTVYGIPSEHLTVAVDVAVSVPVTATMLPKFMLVTFIAQFAVTVIWVVKLNVVVAADASCWLVAIATSIVSPVNLFRPIRIISPGFGVQRYSQKFKSGCKKTVKK